MPELVSTLLPLLAIFLVFWLLIIRPQRTRAKALQDLRDSLNPGDRVMMTAGIFGTLRTCSTYCATDEQCTKIRSQVCAATRSRTRCASRRE